MSAGKMPEIIIIGGGLQGCSTALHLALRGRKVLVLEKNTAGRHASGVNAGGVRRLFRAPEEIPLSIAAQELWHKIETLVDNDCGFRATGQVKIAENADDMHKLEERADLIHTLGYTHEELVDQQELRRLVPAVSRHCVGALVSRNDGFAEPYLTSRAFRAKAISLGVALIENCPVTAVERLKNLWRVHAGGRFFDAPVLTNCAGAWSARIAAMIGDKVPLTPEALTMMVTARKPPFLDPVVGLTSRKLSFKQMPNGTVVIGGGHRSNLNLEKEQTHIDFSKISISAQTASDIFPIIRDAPVIRCWAGIEGFMPDQIPVIGPSQAAPYAFHAFGFSGHGFQLSPIVGKIMADLITQGHTDFPIAPFRIDRFSASYSLP